MKIAAVVVTFNRKEYLLRNIAALLGQKGVRPDIIVVDNASTDGTREAVEPYIEQKQILYENTGANLGGAGGFHYGIRMACEKGYDYIWVMDDDTYPHEDALQALMGGAEKLNGNYGYLASEVLWTDGSLCEMNKPKYKNPFGSHMLPCEPIVQSSFVSMLIPERTVEKYGLPIKEFFIWGDDVEYSRRIGRREPCYLIRDSRVVHATANNLGSDIVYDDDRLERYRYAYRNEMYIALHEGIRRRIYQRLKIMYHILKIRLHSANKKEKIALIRSASREGRIFDPAIEYLSDQKG